MSIRNRRAFSDRYHLTDYSSAAVTVGTNKREWVVPTGVRINRVHVAGGGAGGGAGSTTIDINLNGTTIFTTQGNRPSLATASTGAFTDGLPDVTTVTESAAGSGYGLISYDVDAVPATSGHTRVAVAIILGLP